MPPGPAPDGEPTTSVFDRAAASFDAGGARFFATAGRMLVDLAGLGTGQRVLDLGAGTGAVSIPAARAVGPTGSVVALDISPAMLERLRERAERERLQTIVTRLGDAANPAGSAGGYDAITAGFVLFMLADPTTAVRRYARLLAPGGRLALSLFGAPDPRWRWLLRLHLLGRRDGRTTGRADLSKPALARLLSAAGFGDIQDREHTLRLHFAGPSDWWHWSWSHGERAVWEAMSPSQLAAARDYAFNRLEQMADPSGRLELALNIRLTVARRSDDAARSERGW